MSEGEVSCPESSSASITSAALDGQNLTEAVGSVGWNNEHEDKNPFSGFSEEHLEKIDEMLSSEEVKKILQQTVGEDFVTTMAECPLEVSSPIKLVPTKQEYSQPVNATEVTCLTLSEDPVQSAAVNDHAYAIPAHLDPCPVKSSVPVSKSATVAAATTSVPGTPTQSESAASTLISSPRKSVRIAIRKDRKRKFDTDEGDSEQTEDDVEEETVAIDVKEVEVCSVGRGRGRGRGRKVADVILSPQATRVSSRISDLKQQKLAEKILEENRQQEKDAIEAERSKDSATTQDEESSKGMTDEEVPKKKGKYGNASPQTKGKEIGVGKKFQNSEINMEIEEELVEGEKNNNPSKAEKMALTQTQIQSEEEEEAVEKVKKNTKLKGKKKKMAKQVKGKIKKLKVKDKKVKGKKKKKQKSEAPDDQSGAEQMQQSSPKKKKKKKAQSSEEGSVDEQTPLKKVKKKKKSVKSGDEESDGEQSSTKKAKKKKKGDKLKKKKMKKAKMKGSIESNVGDGKEVQEQPKSASEDGDVSMKTLKRKSTSEDDGVQLQQIQLKFTGEDISDNFPLKQMQKGLKKKHQQSPGSSPSPLKEKKSKPDVSTEDDNKPTKKDFKLPVDTLSNQPDKVIGKNRNVKSAKKTVAFKASSELVKKSVTIADTGITENAIDSKPICDTESEPNEQQQSSMQSIHSEESDGGQNHHRHSSVSEPGHENHRRSRLNSVDLSHLGDSGTRHHHHKHDDSSRHRHDSKHSDDTDHKHKHHKHDSKDSKHSEDANSSQDVKTQDSKDSENSTSHLGKHSEITPSKMSRRKSRKSEDIVVDPTVTDLFKPDVIMTREEKKDEAVQSEDTEPQFDTDLSNDTNKLYCVCRQPHNSKFMICCNQCEDWFHGSCVGISQERGKEMEKNNEEYICPICTGKKKKYIESRANITEGIETQILPSTEQGPTNSTVPKTDDTVEGSNSKVESIPEPNLVKQPTVAVVKVEKPDDVKQKTEVVEKFPVSVTQKVSFNQQHQLGEIRKRSVSGLEEKKKKQFKALKNTKERRTYQKCIGLACVFDAREGSVYCSQDCIVAHAKQALELIHDQHKLTESKNSSDNSGKKKVVVLDRRTGRIVTGPLAPTEDALQNWLEQHQTFEVLCPSIKTSSFYSKKEKEKKEHEKYRQLNRDKLKNKLGDKDKHKEKEGQPKDSKDKKDGGPDPVRLNVRSSLRDALAKRASCADDIMLSSSEIKGMAVGVEEELFRYFNEVGNKYKAKYRTLLFNIKDTNNKVLFRRILTGRINPFRLVRMSVDELATKELSQWREHETKQILDMIEQTEKEHQHEIVHIVKKTHKGEVDVEEEDLSTLQDTYKTVKVEKVKTEPKVDLLSELIPDTTDKHRTHLFDLNCKICTGKLAPSVDEPAQKKVKIAHSVSKEDSADAEEGKEKKLKEEEIKPEDVVKEVLKAIQRAKEESPVSHKASAGSSVTIRSPDSALQSGLEKKPKFTPSGPMLWKGFIFMQDVTKFITTAYSISGPTNHHLDMQDTIYVCGRIAPEQVWDYLARIKHAGSKDILVIRFIPGTGEEKTSYIQLYSYLNSRSRCGVVGNTGKYIKDFYIVPLASHSKIPSVLKPFNGPGLEENRPHMLIGVMVRVKMKRPSESSSNASQSSDKKSKVDSLSKKTDKKREAKPQPRATAKDSPEKNIVPPKVEKRQPEKTSIDSSEKSSSPMLEHQYNRPSVLEKSKTVPLPKPPLPSPSATRPSGFYTPRIEKPFESNTPNSGSSTPSTSEKISRSSTPTIGKPSSLSIDSKDPIVENYGTEDSAEDLAEVDAYSPSEATVVPAYNPDDEKPYDPEEEAMGSQPASGSVKIQCQTAQVQGPKSVNPVSQKLAVDQMLTKIARSKNPKEATAAMVATLAATPNMDDQRKFLQQLTEKVESKKRLLHQRKIDKNITPSSPVHETSVSHALSVSVSQPVETDIKPAISISSMPTISLPQSVSEMTILPSTLNPTSKIVTSVTASETFTTPSSESSVTSVLEKKSLVTTESSSVSTTSEQSVMSTDILMLGEPAYTISKTLQSTIKSLFSDVPLPTELQKRLKSQVADSTSMTDQLTVEPEPSTEPSVDVETSLDVELSVDVEPTAEKPKTVIVTRIKKKEKRSKTFLGFEYESSSSSEEDVEETEEEEEVSDDIKKEESETSEVKLTDLGSIPFLAAEKVVSHATVTTTEVSGITSVNVSASGELDNVLPFLEESGEGSDTPTQDEPAAIPTGDESTESVLVAATQSAETFQLPNEDQDLRIQDIDERIGNSRNPNDSWMKQDQNPFLKVSEPSESGDAETGQSDVPAWAQDVDHRKLCTQPLSQPFPFLQPTVQPAPPLPPSPPPPPPPPDQPDWSDDHTLQDYDMRVQRKTFHMQPESELVPPGEEAVPQDIDLRKCIPPSLLQDSKQNEDLGKKEKSVDNPVGADVADELPMPLPPLPPQMLLNVPQKPPVHMMMGMPQTSTTGMMMNIPRCSSQESSAPKRLPPVRFDTATGKIEVLLTPDGSIPEEFQSENFVADDYGPQNYPKYGKEEVFEDEMSMPQDKGDPVQSQLGISAYEAPPMLRHERRTYQAGRHSHRSDSHEHRISHRDSNDGRYESNEHRSHRSQDDRPMYRDKELGFGREQSRGRGFDRGMTHGHGFPGNRGRGRGPRRGRGRGCEWFT